MVSPQFLVIASANGSGKTTSASAVLPPSVPYVNADEIARSLRGSAGTARDVQAGRRMLQEWQRLEAQRSDFAVETTLANRALAARIARLQTLGYEFHLVFFWLSSPDLAVADTWRIFDNSRIGETALVAAGHWEQIRSVYDASTWAHIQEDDDGDEK